MALVNVVVLVDPAAEELDPEETGSTAAAIITAFNTKTFLN